MNTEMQTQIQQAIRENLPSATAGALQEELFRLQEIEEKYHELHHNYEELLAKHQEVVALRTKEKTRVHEADTLLETLKQQMEEVKDQEQELTFRENLLDLKEQYANVRVQDHQRMVELIFRGPVFQKSVVERGAEDKVGPPPSTDNYGVTQYPSTYSCATDKTTTTTEETK